MADLQLLYQDCLFVCLVGGQEEQRLYQDMEEGNLEYVLEVEYLLQVQVGEYQYQLV